MSIGFVFCVTVSLYPYVYYYIQIGLPCIYGYTDVQMDVVQLFSLSLPSSPPSKLATSAPSHYPHIHR